MEKIEEFLFENQDLKYRDFNAKLIPTVPMETVVGVRTPVLRGFAKQFAKEPEAKSFMEELPHRYYEENNIHGFIIETIKDYDECVMAVKKFLPYIDNWATCDLFSPKVFKKHLPEFINEIRSWVRSDSTYTIRFGIEMLMSFYLNDAFLVEYNELVADIESEEYYVNMMRAWYFATALAKQYEETLPFIEGQRLDVWTHNKSIQKAIESRRITDEQKIYLRSLKIK